MATRFNAPLRLKESGAPAAAPDAEVRQLYLDEEGRLALLRSNGVTRQHLPVVVSQDALPPSFPEVDDLWIVPDANPTSAPSNFAIGATDPGLTQGMWVQTGLGENGDDWTIWIEDGS